VKVPSVADMHEGLLEMAVRKMLAGGGTAYPDG